MISSTAGLWSIEAFVGLKKVWLVYSDWFTVRNPYAKEEEEKEEHGWCNLEISSELNFYFSFGLWFCSFFLMMMIYTKKHSSKLVSLEKSSSKKVIAGDNINDKLVSPDPVSSPDYASSIVPGTSYASNYHFHSKDKPPYVIQV